MSAQPPVIWVVAVDGAPPWVAALRAEGFAAGSLTWAETRDLSIDSRALPEAELVLLTSRRATRALAPAWCAGRPAACVGRSTADVARDAGFEVRLVGQAGGAALAAQILALAPQPSTVLFLRGEAARLEAVDLLRAGGVLVEESVVYTAEPCASFASDIAAAPAPQVVVVGSPRGASALAEALTSTHQELSADVRFVVPGATTAEEVAARLSGYVAQASEATPEALVAAVHEVLKRSARAP